MPVYALNLFDVVNRESYLEYAKRSVNAVAKHQGKVIALGKFREAAAPSQRHGQLYLAFVR
ncbi:MAG: Protein of unknown function (DUF1330) [Idiomarinaceae bacterium HL-53]|nr:MAG: Protein of unknown function (DUF1330) [Idiomarinaceae bacterium HL-53]CUS48797.1 protein of unknown function (DUF1330) [Idiomarinaceae bacterium HL-53]